MVEQSTLLVLCNSIFPPPSSRVTCSSVRSSSTLMFREQSRERWCRDKSQTVQSSSHPPLPFCEQYYTVERRRHFHSWQRHLTTHRFHTDRCISHFTMWQLCAPGSSAEQGGSISISLESIGEIRGSRFEKGKAFSEGGAIYVAEQSELCVYDSSFSSKSHHLSFALILFYYCTWNGGCREYGTTSWRRSESQSRKPPIHHPLRVRAQSSGRIRLQWRRNFSSISWQTCPWRLIFLRSLITHF